MYRFSDFLWLTFEIRCETKRRKSILIGWAILRTIDRKRFSRNRVLTVEQCRRVSFVSGNVSPVRGEQTHWIGRNVYVDVNKIAELKFSLSMFFYLWTQKLSAGEDEWEKIQHMNESTPWPKNDGAMQHDAIYSKYWLARTQSVNSLSLKKYLTDIFLGMKSISSRRIGVDRSTYHPVHTPPRSFDQE